MIAAILITLAAGLGAVLAGGFVFLNSLGGKATQEETERECARIRAELRKDAQHNRSHAPAAAAHGRRADGAGHESRRARAQGPHPDVHQ